MHIERFVNDVQRDLGLALPEDSAAAEHAERLAAALGSSLNLAMLKVLAAAADELSAELAPASVSLTLSGGEPRLTASGLPEPVQDQPAEASAAPDQDSAPDRGPGWLDADAGNAARFNLRLPEQLKAGAEAAAAAAGLSLNSWLVRVVAHSLTSTPAGQGTQPGPGAQVPKSNKDSRRRVTGWMN